jgi:hypothetical protein
MGVFYNDSSFVVVDTTKFVNSNTSSARIIIRLRTKRHDKRDNFNFLIVNFPFICSNIPTASAYGVYISKLTRYSRGYGSY